MSGTHDGVPAPEPTPAEQHLGDRLAALVDGELGHETRERVLAHLATCHTCKAEADAQRRLKSVFADAAPPPPSERLLARLQGLPGGLDDDPGRGRGGPPDSSASSSPWDFEYLPADSVLTSDRGFRIHRVHEADRSSSRGRRFAFAAAGAVSLAAFAIGGALTSAATGGSTVAAGGDGGTSARSPRTAAVGTERGGERSGGRPGQRAGKGTSGTPSGPAVAPTRPPVLSVSPLEAAYAPRPHELTVVPVIEVLPTLHPPLIHPTQYGTPPGEGPPERQEPVRQPLIAATPMAAAPSATPTAPAGATPAPTLPPGR
ncbi:zf-HC2 domain-containing protein [Streptomyces sp. S1A]|uniref:anti-sigma factor family protein n=1 Tax=Streptomyces sp. ICN903 TaxID=2964654 RepID=UPI001EDC38B0|nr:zf-HC2 domain-containing protein [Streptomyces sp. ICN903]MCG3042936.1 zf-HC2 domain-containing protein [Streptomyces sp. ICN903]